MKSPFVELVEDCSDVLRLVEGSEGVADQEDLLQSGNPTTRGFSDIPAKPVLVLFATVRPGPSFLPKRSVPTEPQQPIADLGPGHDNVTKLFSKPSLPGPAQIAYCHNAPARSRTDLILLAALDTAKTAEVTSQFAREPALSWLT